MGINQKIGSDCVETSRGKSRIALQKDVVLQAEQIGIIKWADDSVLICGEQLSKAGVNRVSIQHSATQGSRAQGGSRTRLGGVKRANGIDRAWGKTRLVVVQERDGTRRKGCESAEDKGISLVPGIVDLQYK